MIAAMIRKQTPPFLPAKSKASVNTINNGTTINEERQNTQHHAQIQKRSKRIMGYSVWDTEQMLDAYRRKKQEQYIPPPTSISDTPPTCENQAVQRLYEPSYLTPSFDTDFFKTLEKELPPIFTRQLAAQKTGGLISVKTLSNLDSLHRGPSVKVRIGSKVGYERAGFLQWLRGRVQ